MCPGTFSRRGAVASATIYPCAECASSRSVHSIVMNNCPRQQRTKILCCRGHPFIPAPHPAPSSVQIRPQIQPFPDSNARPPRLPESALLRQPRASRPPQMTTDTAKTDRSRWRVRWSAPHRPALPLPKAFRTETPFCGSSVLRSLTASK